MKGALTGLKAHQEILERSRAGGDGEKRESDFLKLEDGESVTVTFLQELDEDGKNYDEDRGVAVTVFEHIMPKAPFRRFLCTMEDEGRCVGCEREIISKRWRKKPRMYVNVFVKEKNKTMVLPAGFSKVGVAGNIIEFYQDFETLCDRWYKFRRTGSKLDTQYTLYPKEPSSVDLDGTTVIPLDNVLRERSYEEVKEMIGEDTEEEKADDTSW